MSQSSNLLNWQERWLITSTLIAVAAGCLLLTTVVGAGAAIRQGVIVGPEVDLPLGDVRVVAAYEYPVCNPQVQGCQAYITQRQGGAPRYYTIWIITHRQAAGPDGVTDQFGSARLLTVQAPPAPK